jgi:enediyne biosynthesis protein E4
MNQNQAPSLLRKVAPAGNHGLKVRLQGTKSNRSAIGGRVMVRYGGKVQAQEVMSQSSYLSCNDPRLHFALGAEKTADIECAGARRKRHPDSSCRHPTGDD